MNGSANGSQLQERIVWVRSYQEVDTYPMVPNTMMQFWDMYYPVVYFKRVDQYGRTSSIEIYDLVKRNSQNQAPPVPTQQQYYPEQSQTTNYHPAPQQMSEYISKEDFAVLQKEVSQIGDVVRSLTQRLSSPTMTNHQEKGNRKESN